MVREIFDDDARTRRREPKSRFSIRWTSSFAGVVLHGLHTILGISHYGDEYKVMGLAPYGEPKFIDFMSDVLPLAKNGLFSWDSSYFHLHQGVMSYPDGKPQVSPLFGAKISEYLGPPRQPSEPLTQRHMDVAASVQRHTEMVIFHVLNRLHADTGLTKLCLAGA